MTDWFTVINELDRPIVIYPRAVQALGGHAEAAFALQLRYWMARCDDPCGWVYKSSGELEVELCLSVRQQEYIREKLKRLGVLETNYHRMEHLLYYRLKKDKFNALMDCAKPEDIGIKHSQPTGVVIPPNGNGTPKKRSSFNTENTSESTAENAAPITVAQVDEEWSAYQERLRIDNEKRDAKAARKGKFQQRPTFRKEPAHVQEVRTRSKGEERAERNRKALEVLDHPERLPEHLRDALQARHNRRGGGRV